MKISLGLIGLLCFVLISGLSWAAPVITNVSGSAQHGETLIISGSGFGTKTTAKPLVWDSGETQSSGDWPISIPNVSSVTGYVAYEPGDLSAGEDVPATHELKYRAAPWTTATGDIIPSPHAKSTVILGGGHWTSGTANCFGVSFTVTGGGYSKDWYVSFYKRLDSNWPACGTNQNHKIVSFQTDLAPFTGDYFYMDHMSGNGGYPCSLNPTVGINSERNIAPFQYEEPYPATPPDSTPPWAYFFTAVTAATPVEAWVKIEIICSETNGTLQMYWNNNYIWGGTGNTDFFSGVGANDLGYAGIGSVTFGDAYYRYTSVPTNLTNNNAIAAFDDIYVDNSISRAMLCNNATYASATICEPQPITSWADGSITITANQGALTQGSNYLFVYDSANVANGAGYPVSVGDSPTERSVIIGDGDKTITSGGSYSLTIQ